MKKYVLKSSRSGMDGLMVDYILSILDRGEKVRCILSIKHIPSFLVDKLKSHKNSKNLKLWSLNR